MTKKEEALVEEDSRQTPERYYIKITPDGPYLVYGNPPIDQEVIPPNGEGPSWVYQRGLSFDNSATPVALCRCGHSRHKPFCGGSHKRATGWGSNKTNSERSLFEEAEELGGPAVILTNNEKYRTLARSCDAHDRIRSLIQLAETGEERELVRREATHYPIGRLVVWDKETQKVFKPPLEPSIGIIEDPGIRVSGPIWVKGGIRVESTGDKSYTIRNRVILYRCRQSSNKPFCDGTHASMGLSDGLPLEGKARSGDSAF